MRRLLLLTVALSLGVDARALADEPPPGRWFVHASVGFNVYTHLAASGTQPAADITPSDKAMTFEQVGVGYWVVPWARLQLAAMFGETLTGLKPGASSFTLAAIIPCVVLTSHGFFAGAGPMIAPRAFGTWDDHFGLFLVAGYALALGHGVSLALAVQAPVMFVQRESFAITPALVLGYRF